MVLWGGKAKDCPDLLDKLADLAVEALEQPMLMMRLLEKRIIERALQTYGGNQYKTADFLGCHPAPLTGKLPISVSSRIIATAHLQSADVSLTLTEKQLDDLLVRILFGPIRSMSTAQKIELLLAHAQEG